MLKLLRFLKPRDWIMMIFIVILIVGGVYLDLKLPDYMKELNNLFYTDFELIDLVNPGGMMILCALGSGVISAAVGFITSFISSSFARSVREALYKKVESLSQGEIDDFSTASLITRTTNDVTQIQMTIGFGLQVIIRAPILAIMAISKMFNNGISGWVMLTAIAVAILVVAIVIIIILCLPKFKLIQKQTDKVNEIARENLTGLRVIKAFNAEEYQLNKFLKVNTDLTNTNLFTSITLATLNPLMNLVMNGLTLGIYWIGAYAIHDEANILTRQELVSEMIIFSSYSMQVVMAFLLLVAIFMIVPRAMVSAKRINEILDKKVNIVEGEFDEETKVKGKLVFENVSFSYNDEKNDEKEQVLENISFTITQGQTLAFIGATGSGKSTIVNLAVRFYDPDQGNIYLDDVNLKDYKFKNLYNKIGYVSQKSVMFKGSIKENVFYGESLTEENEENLNEALNISQAEEFVSKKENQADYMIEQGGKNLSGGQKQRVSIARAIARKPEILIFDDSFSALDYKTDFTVRSLLNKELPNTTKIIVAQRIGTIKEADQIIVLDEGKIVGQGTHDQLMKNCKIYQEIALSQLNKEEL